MPDNVVLPPVTAPGGDTTAADEIAGVKFQRIKLTLGADGVNDGDVSSSNPMPVNGTVTANTGLAQPLTDAQLRTAPVPVSMASSPLPTGAATEATLGNLLTTTAFQARTPALGQALMAASQPVTIASDQSIIPVNQAGVSATGDITALNLNPTSGVATANSAVALSLNGATGFAVDLRGTFVATITIQGTINGTNWFSLAVIPAGSGANVATVTTATAAGAWTGNANGFQQVRATATAFTSGTVNVVLRAMQAAGVAYNMPSGQTTQAISGTVSANSTAVASNVRAGFIAGSGIWYDDSATVLAANATFTGTSRDLTVTATATAFANAATYAQELRLSAESDQTGTLWLEVSRDNTNWRRVKSVATAAVAGGGFYAEIIHRPSWRYARVGFTNGATLQTRFSIGSVLMAA